MRTPVDNWREGTRAGHTHEPNDVTVQLDGLGRQLSELIGEPGSGPENSDGPVFVDESGRRSKTYRRVGWVLATICAVYAVTLVVALAGGNSSAPWLPISGQEEPKPAGVEVQPAPTDPTGPVTDTPAPAPSGPAADPVSTGSLPPSGGAPGSEPAGPEAQTSSSAPAPGNASESASGSSEAEPPAGASSAPVAESSDSVEESPPEIPETSDPSVQGQEGAL